MFFVPEIYIYLRNKTYFSRLKKEHGPPQFRIRSSFNLSIVQPEYSPEVNIRTRNDSFFDEQFHWTADHWPKMTTQIRHRQTKTAKDKDRKPKTGIVKYPNHNITQ